MSFAQLSSESTSCPCWLVAPLSTGVVGLGRLGVDVGLLGSDAALSTGSYTLNSEPCTLEAGSYGIELSVTPLIEDSDVYPKHQFIEFLVEFLMMFRTRVNKVTF